MSPIKFEYSFVQFRNDMFGAITSTVVILPLSLALGIATGLGASAGIYGAVAVGFFAAVFGGTSTQISAPTAPMAVAMSAIIATYAQSMGEAFLIVSMAGIMLILLGLSGVGRYIIYTPRVVISGFMSGIGVIIIVIDVLPLIGGQPVSNVVGTIGALAESIKSVNFDSLLVGTVALAFCVLWPRQLRKFAPAPLVALVVGAALGMIWFTDLPVIGEIPTGLPELRIDFPPIDQFIRLLEPALILALIGAVDSLLTSLVADTLTGTEHNSNKELVGQGIGNFVAGLIGGMPSSGATPGTVANIKVGARTFIAGASYPIVMVLVIVLIADVIEAIPLAVLAGILIKVGWDAIDWRVIRCIHKIERSRLVILLLTLGVTVFVDLLTAVALGLIASSMSYARTIEAIEIDNVRSAPILDAYLFEGTDVKLSNDPFAARTGILSMVGAITIAAKSKLVTDAAEDLKDHNIVIFDFTNTKFIDDDIALLIEQFTQLAEENGIHIIVCGLSESIRTKLNSFNALENVPTDRIVNSVADAEQVSREILTNLPQ